MSDSTSTKQNVAAHVLTYMYRCIHIYVSRDVYLQTPRYAGDELVSGTKHSRCETDGILFRHFLDSYSRLEFVMFSKTLSIWAPFDAGIGAYRTNPRHLFCSIPVLGVVVIDFAMP